MKKNVLFLFIVTLITTINTFASPSEKQITITLADSINGVSSQAIVYFDINLHTTYVYPEDSQIIFDTSFGVPQIYSFTSDGVPCYVNGYGDFTNSVIVPLGVRVNGGSTYIFSQSQISNFDPTSMIILEDRLLGVFTNLRQHYYAASISQQGRLDGRFFLHFSYPPQVTDIAADCNNENGTILVTEDSTVTWSSCLLYDSASHLIASLGNVTGNFAFPNLFSEAYSLEFDYGTYAAARPFFLVGGEINLVMSASSTYADTGQVIQFTTEATNATVYDWDFGDGSMISGVANPSYSYQYKGDYAVTLLCSNIYSCHANGALTMHIFADSTLGIGSISANEVKISNDNKDVRITISNIAKSNYTFEIRDLSGQILQIGPINSSDFTIGTDNFSTGIYLVTVKNNSGGTLTKKIFLP